MSRRSVIGKSNYPEFKVFLNNPDTAIFPSGSVGSILPSFSSFISNCNGQYYIIFSTNKAGLVQAHIDINSLPGIQPEDVIILDSVRNGIDTITWNGLNGLGNPVPSNSFFNIEISFLNGVINFPIYNTPGNNNGFKVGVIRPLMQTPLQYWNDTLIPNGQIQLDGCLSTLLSGCHVWPGTQLPTTGFGIGRTLNTWWYSSYPDTIFNASLSSVIANIDSIAGPKEICFISGFPYVYSLIPNPLEFALSRP